MAEAAVRIGGRRDESAEREACERSLANAGVRLPLPHRAGWTEARRGVASLWVPLRGPGGGWAGAFAADAAMSRALPGFRLLRVERFGEAIPSVLWPAAVDAVAALARRGRVLRVSVEVFSRDDTTRAAIGALLAGAGFTRAAAPRNWSRTLTLDLQPTEDTLLASFSPTVRQGVRAVGKLPVQVLPVVDPSLAPRLNALLRETFARSGGRDERLWDWAGVIALSRRAADASRLVGMFRTDREGPDALLGFAWGWWNGESVSYVVGASTRPGDLRVQIGHPLLWDLIVWAKRGGAAWFDLGGVSPASAAAGDPTGGISDFKRRFSKHTADVADDWVLEPHWLPARLATLVSTGARWLGAAGARRVSAP